MARYYVSPSETLNRAVRAGLPAGIEESCNALWAKNGAMLTADAYGRSFRWVVTEADCATDHEFAPSRFSDALAALVELGNLPVPAEEPELPQAPRTTHPTVAELDAFLDELFSVPDKAA